MYKYLILTTLLFLSGKNAFSMEEKEAVQSSKDIDCLDRAFLEKLIIDKFTFEQLPDELLLQILTYLASGPDLSKSIGALKAPRKVSKRFDILINDRELVKIVLNYWSKKYNIPHAHLVVLWNTPGTKEWINLQAKSELDIKPQGCVALPGFHRRIGLYILRDVFIEDSPIFLAIDLNYLEFIETLLKKGVDINQRDSRGQTILIHAIKNHSFEIVKLLVENGVDVNLEDEEFESKNTPIMSAVIARDAKILEFLLANGASLDKKNSEGKTALGIAEKFCKRWSELFENIVEILKDYSSKQANAKNLQF